MATLIQSWSADQDQDSVATVKLVTRTVTLRRQACDADCYDGETDTPAHLTIGMSSFLCHLSHSHDYQTYRKLPPDANLVLADLSLHVSRKTLSLFALRHLLTRTYVSFPPTAWEVNVVRVLPVSTQFASFGLAAFPICR